MLMSAKCFTDLFEPFHSAPGSRESFSLLLAIGIFDLLSDLRKRRPYIIAILIVRVIFPKTNYFTYTLPGRHCDHNHWRIAMPTSAGLTM